MLKWLLGTACPDCNGSGKSGYRTEEYWNNSQKSTFDNIRKSAGSGAMIREMKNNAAPEKRRVPATCGKCDGTGKVYR